MNEYRCTRALPYADFDYEDRDNPKLRQGYYLAAEDAHGAMKQMAEAFPDDVDEARRRKIRPFTVSFHKTLYSEALMAP